MFYASFDQHKYLALTLVTTLLCGTACAVSGDKNNQETATYFDPPPNDNQLLPDFKISDFRQVETDFDGFDWRAKLSNVGDVSTKIPRYISMYESISSDFKTGFIKSTKQIQKLDDSNSKNLESGETILITGKKDTYSTGLVAGFSWTPTFVRLEINADYGTRSFYKGNNSNTYMSRRGLKESNYDNNTTKTIEVKRDRYDKTPYCNELDEEENDTFETAQRIELDKEYNWSLCLDDTDIFRISLERGKIYKIYMGRYPLIGRIVIIDPNNNYVADMIPSLANSRNRAGMYFVAEYDGDYTLAFTLSKLFLRFVDINTTFKIKEF